VEEGRVQVHRVVVAAPLFTYVEHTGPAQTADKAPNGAPRQGHGIRDLLDGAVRVDSDVEDDGAVAGDEMKGVNENLPPQ